jgi:hypothetical protein
LEKAALAQEIFIVEEEFVEAGAGDVDEAKFGLAGSIGGAAALGNILATTMSGLNHLVTGSGALVDKVFAEIDGGVVDDGGDLKGMKAAVANTGAKPGSRGWL